MLKCHRVMLHSAVMPNDGVMSKSLIALVVLINNKAVRSQGGAKQCCDVNNAVKPNDAAMSQCLITFIVLNNSCTITEQYQALL